MSKIYKKIYKLDSVGNTRVLQMERDGAVYRTHTGILGGKIVTTDWTLALPKNVGKANETSAEQQAEAEIVAQYTKKLKTGYTLDQGAIETALPYVAPMLAKKYLDYKDKINFEKEDWVVQLKYNGTRCVSSKHGCFTRKGERYKSVPHIELSLKPFFERYPDSIIDGEFYNYDLRAHLNELSKLVRKTVHISDADLKRSEELVQYHVYDGYNFDGLDQSAPYWCRKEWLDKYLTNDDYPFIIGVHSYGIKSIDDLDTMYTQFVEDGEEGCMLRDSNSAYENKRSKSLLKLKPENSEDAVILDIKEGQGNWSGAGKIVSLDWNGKVFDATLRGTYEEGVEFLQNKDFYIGKMAEFLFNGLTGLGTPSFARVDYNNCLK